MTLRRLTFLILVNAVVLAGLLLLLECSARVFVEDSNKTLFEDTGLRTRGRPFVEPHPTRGFSLIKGFSDELYTIDNSGFRTNASAAASAQTLIAFGESTTFGWGAGNRETYPAWLQQQASDAGGTLKVLNAGVPSYSSTQVSLYLQEVLEKQRPGAVLVNIMWNDIWYSTVLNWYPELLIYQQPPQWLTTALGNSALLREVLLQPAPEAGQVLNRHNPRALKKYRENLEQMIAVTREKAIPIVFVEPPFCPDLVPAQGLDEFQVRYTKPFLLDTAQQYRLAMHEVAKLHGIPVLDHRLSLNNGGGPKELFIDLLHPTGEGNRLMANDILDGLVAHQIGVSVKKEGP